MAEKRVAVVTGASRGVGKGIAIALGEAGMVVYCNARSAARQLAGRGVSAVALYPGLVRTEDVLRAGDFFDLSNSESPVFVGRAVSALAADPDIASLSGGAFAAAELAERCGFTDVDGRRPTSLRGQYDGASSQ